MIKFIVFPERHGNIHIWRILRFRLKLHKLHRVLETEESFLVNVVSLYGDNRRRILLGAHYHQLHGVAVIVERFIRLYGN